MLSLLLVAALPLLISVFPQNGAFTEMDPDTKELYDHVMCIPNCLGRLSKEIRDKSHPVCGTDDETYHNVEALTCARECGHAVEKLRDGVCYIAA